ncbi:DUF1373 domain-containing protein [Hymenobacter taeanensis]|uniref:DUF1373 domain-containing protein n=1 Tax=Hymenobacter taeanensis TaxID=2735321 RepID=A0A6M6BDE1_9BACT|nr:MULTISPECIES: DUF1373 domain-containing protein [Hymenobacter]QJX45960.1 DUF1373 domain-containing protein [Hymenobacter taeanensis]UOQ79807.1 DUF1373 domain-containing protein [Hymenobacter sp. 5414T-23]
MMMMRKLYVLMAGLLLGSVPVLAQGEKQPSVSATVTPTALPGEEKLSAQERAERDFLMPVRRKQAAALRAAAHEEATTQPAVETAARALEAVEAPKPEEAEAKPAYHRPTTSSHRTSHSTHRTSSSHRSSSSSKRKPSSSAKKKTTSAKTSTRRRR